MKTLNDVVSSINSLNYDIQNSMPSSLSLESASSALNNIESNTDEMKETLDGIHTVLIKILQQLEKMGVRVEDERDTAENFDPNYLNKIVD